MAQHTYKIAFMDISKGANQRVVISDLDGTLPGAPIVASWRFEKERSLAANEALS